MRNNLNRRIASFIKKNSAWLQQGCYWQRCIQKNDFYKFGNPNPLPYRIWFDRILGCDCGKRFKNYLASEVEYQRFLANRSFVSCADYSKRLHFIKEWQYHPHISILLPVYRIRRESLIECLSSVEDQIYPYWELCIVEDGSSMPEIIAALNEFSLKYPAKVKLAFHEKNQGIVSTSQHALELATGDYIALLDHDDRLAPEAIFEVVSLLNKQPETDWIYSDNDQISEAGERCAYHPKPVWSPELLLSYNYILHLSVIRRELVLAVGGFRKDMEGSQDHDLYLRIAEKTDRIKHIQRILYSWRQSANSVSSEPDSKPYAYEAALRAINDALKRRGETGKAVHAPNSWLGSYRILRSVPNSSIDIVVLNSSDGYLPPVLVSPEKTKKVAIKKCVHLEAGEKAGQTLIRVLEQTTSPFILITTGNVSIHDNDILDGLISNLIPKGVAAVSAKVVDIQGIVDHCGLSFSTEGKILFPLRGVASDVSGHGAHGALPRNVIAVSPVFSLFDTNALRQVSQSLSEYSTPCGAVIAACFALLDKGFRMVADGGLSVVYTSALYLPDSGLLNDGSDFNRLKPIFLKHLGQGDPYYNRNLREVPADFRIR